jgi:hypothetical protein
MNYKTYFLPIKSENLASYFVKGCICPTNYLKNRNSDIQDMFENQILLSNNKFTDETNCYLEIVLDEKTEIVEQISDNFFLLITPIPITRIKKIFFKNEDQKVVTSYNINDGDAFLPKNLIAVDTTTEEINTLQLTNVKFQNSLKDWSKELEHFDRLMGGFAVMSIAGNEVQNYPLNYFNTLSFINNLVGEEIKNQEVEVIKNQEWAIIRTDKYYRLYDAIYNKIDDNVVEKIAKNDKIQLHKSNGKFVIDKIDQKTLTYTIAILGSYGKGTRQTIDDFISHFNSNTFAEDKKEGIALSFGINQGYEVLKNNYKTTNFNFDIKFKLDSQLDYFTIESIYQFAFNNKRDNRDFEYLNWVNKYNDEVDYNGFETYEVLDKTIIIKKKEKIGFKEIFQSISRNKIYQKIISEINKCIPKYLIDKDDIEGTKYFTNLLKEDFEEYENEIYKKAKEEIETELNNKFEKKNNEKSLEIEKLNNFIFEQKNEIKKLEEIIEKSKSNINFNTENNPDPNEPLVTIINSSPYNYVLENDIYAENINDENLINDADNKEILVVQNDNSNRKQELKKLNITNLRKEAEKLKVDNFKAFKNNPDDMDKLIEAILYVESQKGIF